MAIKYSVHERTNPLNREDPKKWYATARSGGELTFRKRGKEIAEASTTVSDTDVLAVLNDLIRVLRHQSREGQGDLFTLNTLSLPLTLPVSVCLAAPIPPLWGG